ncbi:LAMI_0F04214g1_1 [Lachancea mirantina]|uniref:LAMI_0F04214g1_1 n=1 Tax=Lachancea mirantina TaxID=1230905 RepID=A0A1G4JXN6_9SACH|nr:LAMI_0F04214g1_1 [Lachancea mirantina]
MWQDFLHYVPFFSHVKQTKSDELLKFKKCGESTDMSTIIDRFCPEFSDNSMQLFNPVLCSGHLQTIYAALRSFEEIDQVYYKRLVVKYCDGGEGTADFAVDAFEDDAGYVPSTQRNALLPQYAFFTPEESKAFTSQDDKPLLIVLHGLTGGSHESYVRGLVNRIRNCYGFEACVLNSRGCCESSITTPQLYNGMWTDDVREFVKQMRQRFPNRKFYLVGFSLGGSIAANYLGQEGENSDIECASVLGSPWDLCDSSYFLTSSWLGRLVYSRAFSKRLVKLIEDHLEVLREDPYMAQLYAEKLDKIETIEDFDNWFTAPMFGFNTSYEYYRHGSSANRLPQVRTPLLAINATDDPIVGSQSLPLREFQDNPYLLMVQSSKGGHIGWFDATGERWYLDPLCKFFSSFHAEVVAKDLQPDLSSVKLPHKNKFVGDRLVNATVRDY